MASSERGLGAELGFDARRLLDGLGDAVVVADSSGTIVYVNERTAELLRSPALDLVGSSLLVLVPERLRGAHAAGFRRYAAGGAARLVGGPPVRLPALRADGTEVEIDLLLRSHRADDGSEVFVATLRDIAERIELERQRDIARYLATSHQVTTRLALGAEAASLEEAAPILLEALAEGLGWDGGSVWAERGGVLEPVARWSSGSDELAAVMTAGSSFRPGEGLPGSVYVRGEAMWIETVSDSEVFVRRQPARSAGVTSCFAFPVYVGGSVEGVVEMYSRSRQPPEPELLAVLQSAGLEIGRYLERAQARRHLVEMAEALQASLLPPRPPTVPGLDLAVRYRAAGGGGMVGGDFFDIFPMPDGEWVIVIGDVSGRGPRAAALTALARYTLRAAAVGAPSPSAALRVLNDVVRRELESAYEGDERFLTAAYLTVSPSIGGLAVRIACGGHPVPLARRVSGEVDVIRCEGELIGAFDAHEALDEAVELRPGEVLVLVTDGVLEARNGGEEFGEERLRAVVASAGDGPAAQLADAIEEAVLGHVGGLTPDDDVAIVVVRLPPAVPSPTASIDVTVGEAG